MNIRILPMSKLEFDTMDDVLQFLTTDLPQRGGNYYFRRRSIVYKEDILIAFQYGGRIVASAVMTGQSSDGKYEDGVEYKGYYQFDVNSFIECNPPITAEELKNIMPEFNGFNQSTQYLAEDCYKLLR